MSRIMTNVSNGVNPILVIISKTMISMQVSTITLVIYIVKVYLHWFRDLSVEAIRTPEMNKII